MDSNRSRFPLRFVRDTISCSPYINPGPRRVFSPSKPYQIAPPGRRTGSPEFASSAAVFHGFCDEVSTSPPETALLVSPVSLRTSSCLRANFLCSRTSGPCTTRARRNFTAPPAPPRRCTAAEPTPPLPSNSPCCGESFDTRPTPGEPPEKRIRRRPRQRRRPLHRRPPERRHGKVIASWPFDPISAATIRNLNEPV